MRAPTLSILAFFLSVTMASSAPTGERGVNLCAEGPWGGLEYYYTYVEAPSRLMDLVQTPSQKTIWHLPDKSLDEIDAFLRALGISEAEIELIYERSLPYQLGPPFRLFPPVEVVTNLSSSARSELYRELRRFPANVSHRSPAIIESGDVAAWFSGSELRPNTIQKISELTYQIGNATAFSDAPIVIGQLESDHEERAFLKALTRTRSLVLRLRIRPGDDLSVVKNYWSANGKNEGIESIIESLAANSRFDAVDAVHLLPPSPRKHLYTFPSFSLGVDGVFPDSYWAALNFFNYSPNPDFNDRAFVDHALAERYEVIDTAARFGDLVLIQDPVSGDTQQAAVFIADDIVYTKNGRSLMRPFMFMKLGDLLARYASETAPKLRVFRLRDHP